MGVLIDQLSIYAQSACMGDISSQIVQVCKNLYSKNSIGIGVVVQTTSEGKTSIFLFPVFCLICSYGSIDA